MEKNLRVNEKETIETPSWTKTLVREFKKDKFAMISLVILILMWATIFIGAVVLDQEEVMKVDVMASYLRPGEEGYILGTDQGGRSIMGQLIIGGRNSVVIGVCITVITTVIGIIVGLISGFFGGRVDNFIMRIIDFIGVLPMLMIVIVLVTIVPKYNVFSFVVIMSLFNWAGLARLTRSLSLTEARRDYVSASKTMGTNKLKIMLTGILPNISSIIIVNSTLNLAGNIGIETGLTYLGFGLPVGTPSLGTLIGYAKSPEVIADRLYVWLPAAMVILVMMICINYIGQAINRASDAKQRLG
ncbi:MAG: ABC transporter permease [Miniphocaeibacter sp.]|uniref:ABC transporter permease n=1 Tax=Miniphocaeibacter sp. TaxID=3100973 RepID=UPI0018071908|nr:ABC transporter permease [Gallicola sp.]